MKFVLKPILWSLMIFATNTLFSQEKKNTSKGKITGKVFFNYHVNTTNEVTQKSAFQLTRAYLGYIYKIDNKLSATVLFDAGNSSGGSAHSVFLKNAKLDYKATDKVTFSVGMIGTKIFKEQEKFWGYRYLYKSFNDEHKLGTSADLGVMSSIKVSNSFKFDILLTNGEGYKKAQDIEDGNTKVAINVVFTPSKNWILKAYFDTMKGTDFINTSKKTRINTMAFFMGYVIKNNFRIGVEYNYLQNGITYRNPSAGKNLEGYSVYSTYIINKKWNIFGRFDNFLSNQVGGQLINWNDSKVGATTIIGTQYQPTKSVKLSLNYRNTTIKEVSYKNASALFVGLGFFF